MNKTINALAPWFGGKRNLAPEIVRELGRHHCYWEPFCGSMAVLLAKPECPMETVNDMHCDLTNLARVIRDPIEGARLYRRLRRTLFAEEFFHESKAVIKQPFEPADVPNVDRAYHFFVVSWMGRSGVIGTRLYDVNFCLRLTANGGSSSKRFASAVESLPAIQRRLRNVAILRRDAFDLLPRIEDAEGTAIYVDPPYIVKGANYLHEFGGIDQHRRLAEELDRFRRARVVVSYYEHPLLDELYSERWTRRRIEVSKALAASGSRSKNEVRAVEVLLLNGPSFVASRSLW